MHLAVVSPFPPAITGIGQYGYHVTRALAMSNAFEQITVLAGSDQNKTLPNQPGNLKIDYCWAPGQWNARSVLLSRMKRLRPDLIWFNFGASIFGKSPWQNLSGLLTPFFARRLDFPTIITMHELAEVSDLRTLNAPGGFMAPLGARLLTSIVSQTDVLCLTMSQYTKILTDRGADCLYIPIGAYHQPEMLAESNSHDLLFFTTLAPFKGLELLIAAFGRLQPEFPDLTLTIAGTRHARFPEYGRNLKTQFEHMPGVRWLGEINESDVKPLFEQACMIVLPYAASTGSSSVLYQAATWGRPVIASDLTEIQQLAQESDLQVEFFRNGSLASLCQTIRTLLLAPEKQHQQTAHNFQAIQRARPTETCRKYIHAFNRALEKSLSPKRIPVGEKQPV